MTRPSLLFVTYYRVAPVGQLGVFKRCSRMMAQLVDDWDLHLVHFGGIPANEPTFASIADRVTVHDMSDPDTGAALERAMRRAKPDGVVLGEAPLRGPFRLSHRVATSLGLWQIGVENAFDRNYLPYARQEWPNIDRWLFFGLLDVAVPSRLAPDAAVVPPLLRFPPGFDAFQRDRITVVAYDDQTLAMARRLLELLPTSWPVDALVSDATRSLMRDTDFDGRETRVLTFPDDRTIADSLARARLVIGKAGYGQIVESLQLGARIVCRACMGGITEGLLPPGVSRHVRIVMSEDELPAHMPVIARWLEAAPVDTWSDVGHAHPDTNALAARTLAQLVREGTTAARDGRAGVPPRPSRGDVHHLCPLPFALFAWAIEQKQWRELREHLRGATVWAFDRPLSIDEAIATLEGSFVDAVDLKLLRIGSMIRKELGGLAHITQTCALMWGESRSWQHHEITFDLHLGWHPSNDERLAYVGLTQARTNPEESGAPAR